VFALVAAAAILKVAAAAPLLKIVAFGSAGITVVPLASK